MKPDVIKWYMDVSRLVYLPLMAVLVFVCIFILTNNSRPSSRMGAPAVHDNLEDTELSAFELLRQVDKHPDYAKIAEKEKKIEEKSEELAVKKQKRDEKYAGRTVVGGLDKYDYLSLNDEFNDLYEWKKSVENQKREIARQRIDLVDHPSLDNIKIVRNSQLAVLKELRTHDKPWRQRGGQVIEIICIVLLLFAWLSGFFKLIIGSGD